MHLLDGVRSKGDVVIRNRESKNWAMQNVVESGGKDEAAKSFAHDTFFHDKLSRYQDGGPPAPKMMTCLLVSLKDTNRCLKLNSEIGNLVAR